MLEWHSVNCQMQDISVSFLKTIAFDFSQEINTFLREITPDLSLVVNGQCTAC